MSTLQPLSMDDIERLGELLARIPEPFVPMEADMLDGYLTAICLMKHPPEIADWLPFVFDLDGNTRARLKEPEQSELRKLILRRGAELEHAILHEKAIDPIIYDAEDEDGNELEGQDSILALQSFANGFSSAISTWPELVKNENKAVQAALVGILRYASQDEDIDEETQDILSKIESEIAFANIDEALEDLTACVQEIAEVTRGNEIKKPKTSSSSKRSRH